jgi:hypothetical protein
MASLWWLGQVPIDNIGIKGDDCGATTCENQSQQWGVARWSDWCRRTSPDDARVLNDQLELPGLRHRVEPNIFSPDLERVLEGRDIAVRGRTGQWYFVRPEKLRDREYDACKNAKRIVRLFGQKHRGREADMEKADYDLLPVWYVGADVLKDEVLGVDA